MEMEENVKGECRVKSRVISRILGEHLHLEAIRSQKGSSHIGRELRAAWPGSKRKRTAGE